MTYMSRLKDLVKAHEVRQGGPIAVVIPKPVREKLGIKKQCRFLVSFDEVRRMIMFRALD